MIEIELRAFINEDQYKNIFSILRSSSVEIEKNVKQITYYLDAGTDTRIHISSSGGGLRQKLGKMHENARKEIELHLTNDEAMIMKNIFLNLGFKIKVIWYRIRHTFQNNNIKISLDNTIGYGMILEVEMLSEDRDIKSQEKYLENFINSFGLEPTPKEISDDKLSVYILNWRKLTNGLDESWIDSK